MVTSKGKLGVSLYRPRVLQSFRIPLGYQRICAPREIVGVLHVVWVWTKVSSE